MSGHQVYRLAILILVVWLQHAGADVSVIKATDSAKRFYIIAIGISNYASVNDLCCAAADANAMAEALQDGAAHLYDEVKVIKLVNHQATKSAILQAVNKAAQVLDGNDAFVLYFSGQRSQDATALLPYDALPPPVETALLIRASELKTVLHGIRAPHRLLLFDSDFVDISFVGDDRQGQHVIQAAGPGQRAMEDREQGHGRFTAMLLQGLNGQADANQDGGVSVLELASFVGQQLPAMEPNPQVPAISLYGLDFPLATTRAKDKPSETVRLEDKLDTELVGLIKVYEAKGAEGVQAYRTQHQLDLKGDQVQVKIIAASERDIDALKQHITNLGGTVETGFENNLYATLPVAALKPFVMQESVWRVDIPSQVVSPPGGINAPISQPSPVLTPPGKDDGATGVANPQKEN